MGSAHSLCSTHPGEQDCSVLLLLGQPEACMPAAAPQSDVTTERLGLHPAVWRGLESAVQKAQQQRRNASTAHTGVAAKSKHKNRQQTYEFILCCSALPRPQGTEPCWSSNRAPTVSQPVQESIPAQDVQALTQLGAGSRPPSPPDLLLPLLLLQHPQCCCWAGPPCLCCSTLCSMRSWAASCQPWALCSSSGSGAACPSTPTPTGSITSSTASTRREVRGPRGY